MLWKWKYFQDGWYSWEITIPRFHFLELNFLFIKFSILLIHIVKKNWENLLWLEFPASFCYCLYNNSIHYTELHIFHSFKQWHKYLETNTLVLSITIQNSFKLLPLILHVFLFQFICWVHSIMNISLCTIDKWIALIHKFF